MDCKVGFIGFGLIAGSIAHALKESGNNYNIAATSRRLEPVYEAKKDGVVDDVLDCVDNRLADCDYIILCTPVITMNDYLKQLKNIAKKDCIITDVGSVKTSIHNAVKELDMEDMFIGGHPMCGTEHVGYEYSTAYMLENAYYILTPTPTVSPQKVDEFEHFVTSIGAIPLILDYKKHDFSVGSISHLPTVIASTLVNLVKNLDDSDETLRTIAAGGFKDITRVASSDPTMWENICLANRNQILELIDTYVNALKATRNTIAESHPEEIKEFFSSAKEYRDSFNISHRGPIRPVYQLFCDLIDEAGGIATIATILASNNISIKNIGIIHNREFQQGVLQVEFYDSDAYDHAVELLRKYHYTVYEK